MSEALRSRSTQVAFGVGLVLASVAAATALRGILGPLIEEGIPYVIYLAAVAASTRWAGPWAGALATALSTGLASYLFVDPRGSFLTTSLRDLVSTAAFVGASAMIIAALTAERAARQRSERHERELLTAHEERERLTGQLEEARRLESLGRLAGGVAHDFNNLLTVVSGSCELLRDKLPREDLLDSIDLAARRGSGLVKQLLGVAGRQVMELRLLSPNQAVEEAVQLGQRLLPEDIRLRLELHPAPWLFEADPTQIQQTLLNLLTNARDALPSGGGIVVQTDNVTLDQSFARRHPEVSPGEYVLLRLSDDGEGMSSDIQKRIFEPFFTTKGGRGTGLGLAMVYGVVKQLGGHISCRSAPGQGTTFELYVPRSHPRAVSPSESSELHPAPQSLRILLVEDEELVRRTTAEILRRLGHTVIEADNGAVALTTGRNGGPIDVLVTDVVMPWMNGPDLAARLRATRPELGVVFISGYTDSVVFGKGVLKAGEFLVKKPFTSAEIDDALRRVREAARRTG